MYRRISVEGRRVAVSEMGQWALRYVQEGWFVLPVHGIDGEGQCTCGRLECHSKGKHAIPLRGVHEASNNAYRVLEWWREYPEANIGLATGRSRLALNINARAGGSLSAVRERLLFGQTRIACSGDGWHLYFLYRNALQVASALCPQLGEGVDIRTEGCYMVAPPSLHASGQRYHWRDASELALVPLELWRILLTPRFGRPHCADRARILAVLYEKGVPCSPRELAEVLDRKSEYSSIRKLLRRMYVQGEVASVARGSYVPIAPPPSVVL